MNAVRDLHVATAQCAQQLVLMIARHAERVAGGHHAHDQTQHARGVRTAVDQVADEDRPAVHVVRADGPAGVVAVDRVVQLGQQRLEFGPAAVDVADDVERTGLVPQVVVQPGCG